MILPFLVIVSLFNEFSLLGHQIRHVRSHRQGPLGVLGLPGVPGNDSVAWCKDAAGCPSGTGSGLLGCEGQLVHPEESDHGGGARCTLSN